MAKATWNGAVLAESDKYESVEGITFFPPETVDGNENDDAAWYYPDPKPAAENTRDHVAFWRGVQVDG
ncbi:MAG: DUF427 domain-containing protein [Alphaproteobacteria bacterium]